ncbi:hypothetical protein NRF20_44145 [Streptomyces sp. R-74717]|uniref:hypothetical protein n=1 Tax=Streptomyces TaxID=1883 RepID=UPI0037AC1078
MSASPDHLTRARAADSDRRRNRVLKALDQLTAAGEETSVSSVARAAGVHRSLIHRHGDFHAAVIARAGQPLPGTTAGTQVSRKSLLADVANLTARNGRLVAHITRLERRLSEALGQTAWKASGLGAPADVANLTARNGRLVAHITRLERRLSEALGQTAWKASGLGAPADVETLTRRTTELEQQILDLRGKLAERDEDLEAARAANRELMAQVNR